MIKLAALAFRSGRTPFQNWSFPLVSAGLAFVSGMIVIYYGQDGRTLLTP